MFRREQQGLNTSKNESIIHNDERGIESLTVVSAQSTCLSFLDRTIGVNNGLFGRKITNSKKKILIVEFC